MRPDSRTPRRLPKAITAMQATPRAAEPARTRTRRISSVAYAVDERASEAKTASATVLERRSWRARESGIGAPTTKRFKRLVSIVLPSRRRRRARAIRYAFYH